MKNFKRGIAAMLALLLLLPLLAGCGSQPLPTGSDQPDATNLPQAEETQVPETTLPPPTAPADGDPDDVTCKGSYSEDPADPDAVVALMVLPTEPPAETEPVEEDPTETSATEAVETQPETEGTEATEEPTEPAEPPITEISLTNAELQVWYWMEVAAYRASGLEGPDYTQSLDTQLCSLDDTAITWQQYFLQRALNTWHTSQALVQMAQDVGLPIEEAYKPNFENHEIYLVDIPATKYLYGYNKGYTPNDLHQAYLDSIPALLEELAKAEGFDSAAALAEAAACASEKALAEYARIYNLAYMYFTNLHYYIAPTAEEVEAQAALLGDITGKTVDIRHILLIPDGAEVAADGTVTCTEEAWAACEESARTMLEAFRKQKDTSEPRFAELAHSSSMDAGSALNGGAYREIFPGQLVSALDSWCFDEARVSGDTELIRTDCGWHIVYFSGSTENSTAAAVEALTLLADQANIASAREAYPMTVDYSAIVLEEGDSSLICANDILYPDVAHERYPTVPLYLQQDYTTTRYGNYPITSHGCGITTMSMLASYMTDSELTPPIMCDRFGQYCLKNGTDSRLFELEPAGMGFFLLKKTYDWREAKAAMEEGYTVVCVQHKGFWTRGGHFLVLQEMKENGMLVVRDSNTYNYGKLHGHKDDEFSWDTVIPAGMGYWIYDQKITRIPTCSRCGGETEGVAFGMFTNDYTCEKCDAALQRRNNFRDLCGD